MSRRHPWLGFGALLSTLALAAASAATASGASGPAPRQISTEDVQIVRIKAADPTAAADALAKNGFDLLETRINGDVAVTATADTLAQLKALGYSYTVAETWKGNRSELRARSIASTVSPSATAAVTTTFYGGYRTADAYSDYLSTVAAANPSLAVTYDIGDSWLKTQGSASGNDLKTICITQLSSGGCSLSSGGTKPKLLLVGSVHARELSPTEQLTRLVTELTSKYGTDPEVTAIVNSTEIWAVPLANPDGREIVELGGNAPYLQRKNADNAAVGSSSCANPPTASSQSGVDINRNHAWHWGGVGTSSAPCDQTFRGPNAASEPETVALQTLMSTLWTDQRGPNLTDAAPATTSGMMLTLHSYGNYMIIPWSDTNNDSPNDAGLRSMGFRLSYYNNYNTGQSGEVLYNTTGGTDDWLYGQLGIAAGTIEVGPSSGSCSGFVPAYSCQDTFWSTTRPLLLQAAKLARAPYQLSLGPQTRTVALSAATVAAGTSVTVTATGSDAAYGTTGVAKPTSQTVVAGEYYLDTAPWAGGTATAMTATDKRWNSTTEGLTGKIATTGLSAGKHTVYVRAKDSAGNWGPVAVAFLTIA